MRFVKCCPLCGQDNLPIASFCEKCDADLMNVSVEMRETAPTDGPRANEALDLAKAPAQTQEDEGITETATRRDAVLKLELVANPALCFEVRPGQSVGRSTRADVTISGVPDVEYISREHARFSQRGVQCYVQYIDEGNSIFVDSVESSDDGEMALHDGSILVLSLTPFRVRVCP